MIMGHHSERTAIRVATTPPKPLMIFDGDCGVCRRWIVRWNAMTKGRVDYEPSQRVAGRYPEIPQNNFAQSVQLIEPDGSVLSGAGAVFKSLSLAPGKAWIYGLYKTFPGFAPLSELAYKFVARNRPFFSRF